MMLKVLYKNGNYAYISDVFKYCISESNPNVIEIEYNSRSKACNTYLSINDIIYIGEKECISDNIDFYHVCKD